MVVCVCVFFFTNLFLILQLMFCAMICFVLHMYTVCTAYMCHSVTKRMADEYVCNELYQERKRPEIVSKASQNIKFVL